MNIYILEYIEEQPHIRYEFYDGFVVVAVSNRAARKLAADFYMKNFSPEFLDRKLTTCLKLGEVTGKLQPGVELASFK